MIRKLNFRTKIILFSIVLCLGMIIFCALNYTDRYRNYRDQAYNRLNDSSDIIVENINTFMKSLDSFTMAQFSIPQINSIISNQLLSKRCSMLSSYISSQDGTANSIWMSPSSVQLLSSYFFLDESNYYCFPNSSINNDKENISIYQESFKVETSGPILFSSKQSPYYLYYVRNVYNLPTNKSSGTIIQCFPSYVFENFISSFIDDIDVTITDKDGCIICSGEWKDYGSNIDLSNEYLKNNNSIFHLNTCGTDYLYRVQSIDNKQLVVICRIKQNAILNQTLNNMMPYIVFTLIYVSFVILVFLLLTLYIIKFTNSLTAGFSAIAKENYSIRMDSSQDADISLISSGFNNMVEKIELMIERVREEETLRKESEIKFLQAQINPHFLFNVLTSIRILAKVNGDMKVYDMLFSLGELMYAGITNNEQPLVGLDEELKYIKHYLFLQGIRFEDRLSYEIQIHSEELLDRKVPKLSIESLVENAIVHGLENKIGCGKILIDINEDCQNLIISVSDDGVGFDTDLLNVNKQSHSGIGLLNINRRLQLLFGSEYGLDVQSTIGEGTCVIVRIPNKNSYGEKYV